MEVLFESRDPERESLRALTLMRARFLLRRLAWLAPLVKVRLSDTNGPRAGMDKHCTVEVHSQSCGGVIVHTRARSWRSALDGALSRAARLLMRASRRVHAVKRTGQPALPFQR